MAWRKEKAICDSVAHLDHGTILYVEQGTTQKLEDFMWHKEF